MPLTPAEQRALYIYVQCNRCGEKIATRVDLFNDLSSIYSEGAVTYFCHKIIMGQQRCFQKIEVEMHFDQQRHLTDRQITAGTFITEEDMGPLIP